MHCNVLIAFTGCHTYTRLPCYGGQTIIFQPDRYYAECPNCGSVQLEEIHPMNETSPSVDATETKS